ncbi:MAG TPA: elongation factor P [Candidatus Omnitrophota bacterium]|nr:MAG: Elongation factor P [Candidatus Omnitrophica bacterium ADurb.Bin314]HQB93777.1 elongation factor P [Candidatus Omnitrophota bacterium]
MIIATELRVGNVFKSDGKLFKVITQEVKGTGKFGKSVHCKVRSIEDGNVAEKSFRAEDKIEDVPVRIVKMQYLYRESDQFVFMNMENYEQFNITARAVGRHEVFLKENEAIEVLFGEGRVLSIMFPKIVELKVTSTPPGVKGQSDTTYKEAELENGLKVLVPQFIREGEKIRVNTEDLSYLDRVTVKSMA